MRSCISIKTSIISAAIILSLTGCDVVKLDDNGKPILPISAEAAASIQNMTPKDIAEKIWPDVFSEAKSHAKSWNDVKTEMVKPAEGKNTSYFVKISGNVSDIDLSSKEGTIKLSSGSDVIALQVGPITRGNAIRDAASFIKFDQFKNQVQFAKLSKELNKKSLSVIATPDAAWKGKEIDVIAALTIANNNVSDVIPLEISLR